MKIVLGINSISKVKILCSEYALALVGAVGGNVNVHLLMCGCRDFLFVCLFHVHLEVSFSLWACILS